MNAKAFIPFLLCVFICVGGFAQDIDAELTKLSETLATKISDQAKTKVAVADFTDLQGASSELGKYISEQLTVDLVMNKRNFSVLDRANLKRILAEHKLNSDGLIDPDTAKKLGMFAGVDALVLGTVAPKGDNMNLTVKVITTETAEIVCAAKARFKADETVAQLQAKPATESNPDNGKSAAEDKPGVSKTLGDLRVTANSVRIADNNYQVNLTISNQSKKKSVWVALNSDTAGSIMDGNGNEFHAMIYYMTGLKAGKQPPVFYGTADMSKVKFDPATEISPGDSMSATVKFQSYNQKAASSGACNLQMEFLVGQNFDQGNVSVASRNLTMKVTAE